MARASAAELLQSLWQRVLAPLVCGGPLAPVRPLGPRRIAELSSASTVFRASDAALVDAQRIRHARALWPTDNLEAPSPSQWAMAGALNDLLQCTNPTLDGWISRRSTKLLGMVEETLAAIEPPATVREAVERHATYGLLLSLERQDTHLRWWSGSRDFRGCEPPARLLRWKKVRRVAAETSRVNLLDLAIGTGVQEDRYRAVLAKLLSLSPLTDLAGAARREPPFIWSGPTLALMLAMPGRTLASRALRLHDPAGALQALQRARPPVDPACNAAVQSVVQELSAYARAP